MLTLLLALFPSPIPPAQATTARVEVDVRPGSAEERVLAANGFAMDHGHDGNYTGSPAHAGRSVEIFVPDADLPRLAALGFRYRVIDRGRPLRERMMVDFDARYYDWSEINQALLDFQTQYPTLAKRVDLNATFGGPLTHNGRNIYALKISDNVASDEDEPNVVYVGNHHAREIATPAHMISWAGELLNKYASDAQMKTWVDSHEIWVIPTMNPDGLEWVFTVDDYWRKNRRNNGGGLYGVDLNRNYPFKWAACGSYSTNPSSDTYCGPSPASEPETQTYMAFARARHPSKVIDVHQSGQDVLYPYTCASMPVQASAKVSEVATLLAGAANYSQRLASAGGEQFEWAFHELGSLAYLLELQTAFHPAWNDFLTEFTRVVPAYRAMLGVTPPLHGHARDAETGLPIDGAAFAASGVNWSNGETRAAGGTSGLWTLWLRNGSYGVTVSANGYESASFTASAVGSGAGTLVDVYLPKSNLPNLVIEGITLPGSQIRFRTQGASAFAGGTSSARLSRHGGGPFVNGYSISGGLTVPLTYDGATTWCESKPNLMAKSISGLGIANTSWLTVPASAAGSTIWAAAIVSLGGSNLDVTPALTFMIQ
ncbi:MAG: M14 family zinc carboxypeptidase [Planctomycetota bacterium]|nr:M14 family zinc carboxypeptidase [Planctomycetota bacterium]